MFAAFDAGQKGVTASPGGVQQPPSDIEVSRVVESGLYKRLRDELLPEVSVPGSNARWARQA